MPLPIEEQETDSGEEQETDSGEEQKTDSGEEQKTDSGEEQEFDCEERINLINQIIEQVECQRDSIRLQIADFPFTLEEHTRADLYRRQLLFSRIASLDQPQLVHLVFNLIEMTEDEIVLFNQCQLLDENDVLNASKKVLRELSLSQLREKWFSLL